MILLLLLLLLCLEFYNYLMEVFLTTYKLIISVSFIN